MVSVRPAHASSILNGTKVERAGIEPSGSPEKNLYKPIRTMLSQVDTCRHEALP